MGFRAGMRVAGSFTAPRIVAAYLGIRRSREPEFVSGPGEHRWGPHLGVEVLGFI